MSEPNYVRTTIDDGTPALLGPMSLDDAKWLVSMIRKVEPRRGYVTWIDWRVLPGHVVVPWCNFEKAPEQPTLPLGHLSDRILIEELKRRGYKIPKKGLVMPFNQTERFEEHEFKMLQDNPNCMESAKFRLAATLGRSLLRGGALTFCDYPDGRGHHVLHASGVVIMPPPKEPGHASS